MSHSPQRHQNTGKYTWEYGYKNQWVKCVQCHQAGVVKNHRFACRHCALVLQGDEDTDYWFGACEVCANGRCYHCGVQYHIRENHPNTIGNTYTFHKNKTISCQACGRDNQVQLLLLKIREQGFDNYFGMPLLLTANFKGHLFWAYNDKHLAELKAFIGASLRERHHLAGGHNGSMISRLPLWIKSAKNRDELLTLIEKLEKITPYNTH